MTACKVDCMQTQTTQKLTIQRAAAITPGDIVLPEATHYGAPVKFRAEAYHVPVLRTILGQHITLYTTPAFAKVYLRDWIADDDGYVEICTVEKDHRCEVLLSMRAIRGRFLTERHCVWDEFHGTWGAANEIGDIDDDAHYLVSDLY